ncbi:MAG: SBBP repeat-containing protein [Chitinophagales bacterium]|nr:SBBP repeat-containing protein [Chitinophagales bacterium]
MKKISLLLIFTLFSATMLFAQSWVSRYNGIRKGIDVIKALVVDDAGNVYVTGYSSSTSNGFDYLTIKYNSNGATQWTARYNGPANEMDEAKSIFVDPSGNVYVTGTIDAFSGDFINGNAATIKYSPQGQQLWVAIYDDGFGREDAGNSVKVDAAGNVYITGYTSIFHLGYADQDYLTIKYNSDGVMQWKDTYNGPVSEDDNAVAMSLDPSGNIYVTGFNFSGNDPIGEKNYFTIKYNPSGVRQWTAEYNGPISEVDIATALAVDNNGNAYVTGYSDGTTDFDYATIKYNTNGKQKWVARYNGPANGFDIAYAIAVDDAGNVYVTGGDEKTAYNGDYLTIKYSPSGNVKWTARYAGSGGDNDEAYAIAVDKSGNVYVTGNENGFVYNSNIGTVKYSSSGVEQWVKIYDGPRDSVDAGNAIAVDALGNVYVGGVSTAKNSVDFTTIKYPAGSTPVADKISTEKENEPFAISYNYPNPFSQNTTIKFDVNAGSDTPVNVKLMVYNIQGKEVASLINEFLKSGSYEVNWNARDFPGGIYFYKLFSGESIEIQKMELIK